MSATEPNGRRPRANNHTVVAIVEDKPGVLMRVSSLFRRRGFNIESLTVGPTEEAGLSRITIVVDGESAPIEQVEKQLYKLIDVVKVSDLSNEDMVARELALIKVRANNLNRHELLDIAEVFRADVVDIATNSLMLQVVGDEDNFYLNEAVHLLSHDLDVAFSPRNNGLSFGYIEFVAKADHSTVGASPVVAAFAQQMYDHLVRVGLIAAKP